MRCESMQRLHKFKRNTNNQPTEIHQMLIICLVLFAIKIQMSNCITAHCMPCLLFVAFAFIYFLRLFWCRQALRHSGTKCNFDDTSYSSNSAQRTHYVFLLFWKKKCKQKAVQVKTKTAVEWARARTRVRIYSILWQSIDQNSIVCFCFLHIRSLFLLRTFYANYEINAAKWQREMNSNTEFRCTNKKLRTATEK